MPEEETALHRVRFRFLNSVLGFANRLWRNQIKLTCCSAVSQFFWEGAALESSCQFFLTSENWFFNEFFEEFTTATDNQIYATIVYNAIVCTDYKRQKRELSDQRLWHPSNLKMSFIFTNWATPINATPRPIEVPQLWSNEQFRQRASV